MPKRPKVTEQEIHDMIERDADFAPDFTLRETRGSPNWDVTETRNADAWPPNCAQAFREAVDRARRKFDIVWPWA